jgi:hypothetical protein
MNKKNLLILGIFMIVILSFVLLIKKKDNLGKDLKIKGNIQEVQILEIKEILIEPENPNSSSVVRAIPSLVKWRPYLKIKFNYQWYVNGIEVPDLNGQYLPKNNYKKGDKVYCLIRATSNKEIESEVKKSKTIEILNSPPILNYSAIGQFEVPGDFYYKINAEDPDGDSLEYSLISPTDRRIFINRNTGEIDWNIEALPKDPEKIIYSSDDIIPGNESTWNEAALGDKHVMILVQVKDSDGASSIASIRLNLTKGKEVTD